MKNLLEKGTKCILIQSKFSPFSYWNYTDVCKLVGAKYPAAPLGLMTVAALLPQHWQFKLVDENVEPLLEEHIEWADIVCTGGMLSQQKGIISVINRSHQHGRPVVVGGPDPSSQPNVYQSADYLVLNEGEITIPMFIEELAKGCRNGEFRSEEKADLTKAVIPRFDLIRFKDYLQVGIQYSRGCPFNCEFCDVIEHYGRKPRTKTPEQIIDELQYLYNSGYRGHIDFVDDNFIGNKRTVKKVLAAIKKWSKANNHPFYFSTEASINIANDEDLLEMMRDVDFRFVFVGIETPETKILELTQKKQNLNIPVSMAVKKIYSYGMIVNAGFIIGFDNESNRIADNMINCIQDSGISMAMLGTLYALPKTQLARRLKREGRLSEDSSTLRNTNTQIDQTTNGLNFITTRPRIDILKDYIRVIRYIYDPENYFKRVTYAGLSINFAPKYKTNFMGRLKLLKVFLELSKKLGFTKTTGWIFWKMFFTVLFKNPSGIEPAVNLAAMFLHFHKQSKFIIRIVSEEIENIKNSVEMNYTRITLHKPHNSYVAKKAAPTFVA